MIIIKNYFELPKLLKQYPSTHIIYTDGSFKPPEHNKGVVSLPTYSFVACKPPKDKMFPKKEDVIYTNNGKVEIQGMNEETIIANRNVSGEFFAVIKALEYANKRKFKYVAIVYDLEQVDRIASGESKINNSNMMSVWFYAMLHNSKAKFQNIEKIFMLKVKSHSSDLMNDYADQLAKSVKSASIIQKFTQYLSEK